jgi:transposase-like protein
MPTVAELKQYVDRIWVASFQTDLADALTRQLRQHALAGVRAALEAALDEELACYQASLRAAAREAGRSPSAVRRSGSYQRQLLTSYGFIPDLRIPKLRSGNADRPWQILTRYQLTMQVLLDQALYLYTLGLSIRDLQEAL